MASSASIIANLQRASLGLSTGSNMSDADIAALIASEAKEKERVWKEYGLGAYAERSSSSTATAPKARPNKRFLSSMIRSVDDHNQALLRQQAALARGSLENSSKAQPDRSPPRGMRGWDDITEEAERSSKSSRDRGRDERDKGKERERERSPRKDRHRSSRRRDSRERDKDRDREGERKKGRARSEDEDDRRPRRRRDDDREECPSSSSSRHRRHRDQSPGEGSKSNDHRRARDQDHASFSRSPAPPPSSVSKATLRPDSPSYPSRARESPSRMQFPSREAIETEPAGPSVSIGKSKMDRYFADDYDPAMDVAPVPKDGLVGPGWERMLAVLEEKEEAKRLAKKNVDRTFLLRTSPNKEKKRKEKVERKAIRKAQKNVLGFSSSSESDSETERRRKKRRQEKKEAAKPTWLKDMENREKGVMEMQYSKRGEARAWDRDKVDLS